MPSFDPTKVLRLIGQFAPALPEVAKAAIEKSLGARLPPGPANSEGNAWPCLARPAAMPDLRALRQGRMRRPAPDGSMTSHTARGPAGPQPYKLFRPATLRHPRMLVVMLHGCTQTAEDFATGTRMNEEAARHGFLVAYPEQGPQANIQRCWNWFTAANQRRGSGEPAGLAAVIEEVAAADAIPPGHVFVAGLSAGGAMAAVMGQAYPDRVGGIGIHSGLPAGAAHDVASAFAAMRNGGAAAEEAEEAAPLARGVPTIVIHGDHDTTVHPANAQAIAAAALARHHGLAASSHPGQEPGRHAFERVEGHDAAGRLRFESWTVTGLAHAWSGGSAAVSYTDPAGPDASAAMVRFFTAQIEPRALAVPA